MHIEQMEIDDARVKNAVQSYLSDVRRYPVLSKPEELFLFEKMSAGDREAELSLINSSLRLVVKIVMEYRSGRVPLLDLVQEGNVGLLHAIRKFDPSRNIRFGSYAQWWIRAYVLKYLMDNHMLVKVGTTQAQRKLFYNLKKEQERLQRQGIIPTSAIIARSLNVREKDVIEMKIRLSSRESSLDVPFSEDDTGTLLNLLPSKELDVDETLSKMETGNQMLNYLHEFSETLHGRDITIWKKRMVAEKPQTLQQLGDQFGVSRERARQLEARIVGRLTNYLGERVSNPADAMVALHH